MNHGPDRSARVSPRSSLIAAMLLVLAACAGGAQDPEPTGVADPTGAETGAEEATPTGETDDEPSAAGRPAHAGGGEGPDEDLFEGQATGLELVAGGSLSEQRVAEPFTCDGPGINPPLQWRGVPDGTAALALVMVDVDADPGPALHWQVSPIDPSRSHISGDEVPPGATVGDNGFGTTGYHPICPPEGEEHRYVFTLFALDTAMEPPAVTDVPDLLAAYRDRALAEAEHAAVHRR